MKQVQQDWKTSTSAFVNRLFDFNIVTKSLVSLVYSVVTVSFTLYELRHEKLVFAYVNNKGADQPVHLCTLISTVVCCLDSTCEPRHEKTNGLVSDLV